MKPCHLFQSLTCDSQTSNFLYLSYKLYIYKTYRTQKAASLFIDILVSFITPETYLTFSLTGMAHDARLSMYRDSK